MIGASSSSQPLHQDPNHAYLVEVFRKEAADPQTRAVLKQEVTAQYKDQLYRLNNLYRIIDADGMEVPFRLNHAQKLLYLGLWYLNVVLKSRQHGVTTFACLFFLDVCLFTPNIHAAIIAHNREDAEAFFQEKIKFAYDRLPELIKYIAPATQSSARQLRFGNGSSIRVTTSGRSGTYQLVHISELGKIAAKYPEKAREIVTGTLNTVHPGNWIIIESTAEGKGGPFYDICNAARLIQQAGKSLTKMDYKFFFFPWYLNPLNRLDEKVPILDYQLKYFEELKLKHGIHLEPERKYWYVKKWNVQGDDMKREHPSTPEEAFEAAVKGIYYASAFRRLRKLGRITRVPHQPGAMVDTWWDIGMNDTTAIWFTQTIGREIHVINYYENSDEGLEFYVREVLNAWKEEKGYIYGSHNAPHDIEVREWGNGGKTRLESAKELGIKFNVGPKLSIESGIESVRKILAICWFDEANTTKKYAGHLVGLPSLEQYRKEWDEKIEAYKNRPLHNWACLAGETKILTRSGMYPIMSLPKKGEVMTLCGWKEYNNPHITRKDAPLVAVSFEDGLTVRCTEDHLFLTKGGWKYAKDLQKHSVILSFSTPLRSISMGDYLGFHPINDSILVKAAVIFTSWYGRLFSALRRKDAISTIETVISPTTAFKILSASLFMNTLQPAVPSGDLLPGGIGLLAMRGKKPLLGINQRRVGSGIAGRRSVQKTGSNGSVRNVFALCAEKLFKRLLENQVTARFIVPSSVSHGRVVSGVNKLDETSDVWCLTVPSVGHFCLENGAIVHNSNGADAFRTLAVMHPFNSATNISTTGGSFGAGGVRPGQSRPSPLGWT